MNKTILFKEWNSKKQIDTISDSMPCNQNWDKSKQPENCI